MTINPYEPSRVAEPAAGMVPMDTHGSPTEIEFDLVVDDYVAYCHDYTERMFATRAVNVVIFIIVGLSAPIAAVGYSISEAMPVKLAAVLIFIATIFFLAFAALAFWSYRRSSSWSTGWYFRWIATRGDSSSIFGKYRIALSPKDIFERSPKAEARYDMSIVQKLIVTPSHAFIFISPVQAFIIPRRAFVPAETFESFIHTFEKYSGVQAVRS